MTANNYNVSTKIKVNKFTMEIEENEFCLGGYGRLHRRGTDLKDKHEFAMQVGWGCAEGHSSQRMWPSQRPGRERKNKTHSLPVSR